MIRSHKLDRVLHIKRLTTIRNSYGESIETWTSIAVTRAQRIESTASDFLRAEGMGEEILTVYRCRWRSDVTLDDRITEDGKDFEIVELTEIGRRHGLELRCRRLS